MRREAFAIWPTVWLCAVVLAPPPTADAQSSDEQEKSRPRATPTIRERVFDSLSEALECMDAGDFECAGARLDDVSELRNLTGYEEAQMWVAYGRLHLSQDDYAGAVTAFENVLLQEDLPVGLEQTTLYGLAQLYGQQEQYREGLDALDRWFLLSDTVTADAHILKARYHYALMEYRQGIAPVQAALHLAAEQGKEPEEGWYQLLQVLYFELEDFENVISTVTTLVERWPKKEYLVTLAGVYGQVGEDGHQLALYEAAYEAGWLRAGTELVTLAQMLLQADIPYKAARILERGMAEGAVDSDPGNWRLLAQSWQLAQEDENALPAFVRASELAADGQLDLLLANSYANLARWEECVDAARRALERGGFERTDQAYMVLGQCLLSSKRYAEAKNAFAAAERDERSRQAAEQWRDYAEAEEESERWRSRQLQW